MGVLGDTHAHMLPNTSMKGLRQKWCAYVNQAATAVLHSTYTFKLYQIL